MFVCIFTHRGTDRRHAQLNSLGIASAKPHTKWTTTNSNASNCCDPDVRPDASTCCCNCSHVYAWNSCISVETAVAAGLVVAVEVVAAVQFAAAGGDCGVVGGSGGVDDCAAVDGCDGDDCCSHSLLWNSRCSN